MPKWCRSLGARPAHSLAPWRKMSDSSVPSHVIGQLGQTIGCPVSSAVDKKEAACIAYVGAAPPGKM